MRSWINEKCKTCVRKMTKACKKLHINFDDEACCLWKTDNEEWETEDDKKKIGF